MKTNAEKKCKLIYKNIGQLKDNHNKIQKKDTTIQSKYMTIDKKGVISEDMDQNKKQDLKECSTTGMVTNAEKK